MSKAVRFILNQRGTNKVLYVRTVRERSIIGYPLGNNTNVKNANTEPPYEVAHYYMALNFLTIIGILPC
jgi:hypothetical protein